MKVLLTRALALSGLCAVFACTVGAAVAQDYRYHRENRRSGGFQNARRELQVLHQVYDHEIRSGHPAAAMRAHNRANAIRARLREQRRGMDD
jgi:L-serine deaminase